MRLVSVATVVWTQFGEAGKCSDTEAKQCTAVDGGSY